MLGVGAGGAPAAPPLVLLVGVGAPPPPPPAVVAPPRRPPLFSSSSSLSGSGRHHRRRRRSPAAAPAYKEKQGGRRWWSDSPSSSEQEEEGDEEEYDDFFSGSSSSSSSFGGELFDEPWFSKVFKTYGFLLPLMLASMLVATGPRAFLMAMAIPLAQSAVSFLLDLIWGRNGRRKQSPFQFQEEEEEDDEDFPEYSSDDFPRNGRDRSSSNNNYYGGRRRPQGYQSWGSADFAPSSADNEDDYSAKKSEIGGFGGWDELLNKDDAGKATGSSGGSTTTTYHRTSRTETSAQAQGPGAPLSRRRARRGRMSASTKYKQAPLLMRLMVAVFPFLGSWFRLL